jgi:hypothetical protein
MGLAQSHPFRFISSVPPTLPDVVIAPPFSLKVGGAE